MGVRFQNGGFGLGRGQIVDLSGGSNSTISHTCCLRAPSSLLLLVTTLPQCHHIHEDSYCNQNDMFGLIRNLRVVARHKCLTSTTTATIVSMFKPLSPRPPALGLWAWVQWLNPDGCPCRLGGGLFQGLLTGIRPYWLVAHSP